jgi:hypothetical protein
MSKAPSRSLAIEAVTKEDELRIANEAVSHGAAQALTSQFHASLSIPFERGKFKAYRRQVDDPRPYVRVPPISDGSSQASRSSD